MVTSAPTLAAADLADAAQAVQTADTDHLGAPEDVVAQATEQVGTAGVQTGAVFV